MSATVIVWLEDFVGTRRVIARSSAHYCLDFLTIPGLCNTLGSVPASALRSAENWQNSSGLIAKTRSLGTRGRLGRTMETRPMKPSIACRVARAGGVKARTYRGNHCDPNWWWKSPTTICKEAASVIQHSFADGERTRSPARVLCRLRPLPFNQATTPMRHRGPPMQPVHGPDSGPLGQLSRAV